MSNFLYLKDAQLANLDITADEMLEAIGSTLNGILKKEVTAAPKSGVSTLDGRYVMATLATSDEHGFIAVKSVVFNPHNRKRNFPSVDGAIMLLDSVTGQLRAVLDANWITATRTAGLSLFAAKYLANPQSESIGLIGAGVQAESHLRVFNQCYPLKQVRIVGRSSSGVQRIRRVANELHLDFEEVAPDTCLQRSDIVVSAVTRDPGIDSFVDAGLMSQGAFATIPDLAIPWHPSTLSAFGRIYVDDVAQERAMEKKLLNLKIVCGDLSSLCSGSVSFDPTRSSAFIFRGIAAGDLAIAVLAYQRYLENISASG